MRFPDSPLLQRSTSLRSWSEGPIAPRLASSRRTIDQCNRALFYLSANYDDSVFADPYEFDITRTPNPQVAFGGGGAHMCLGAHLARLEIRVLLEELARVTRSIEPAGPAVRLRSNWVNGLKHLPVTVVPA